MDTLFLLMLTAATLAAAIYAQYRLPFHTATLTHAWITRLVLIVTGVAFGWAVTLYYMQATGINAVLVFLSALGLVHVPAAFILFLKRERRRELT